MPILAPPVNWGCIGLGFLKTFIIDFLKLMTFIEFDRFLKIFLNFGRVCKFMDDFHKLLWSL